MPVSINNTTLTFNDGTTMTSRPVTSVTGAGTVSVSASTGAVTITGTGGTGTVTSVATGNGLQGGTITTSGTLSVAAPGFNTVGSYAAWENLPCPRTVNTNYGGVVTASYTAGCEQNLVGLSGSWRYLGGNLIVRVS